jgi:3-hydroxyisobutyrate dehydrogenase-like beta-hydroxyacid dehydrogenase
MPVCRAVDRSNSAANSRGIDGGQGGVGRRAISHVERRIVEPRLPGDLVPGRRCRPAKDQTMDVGFIGLGHMGQPMARNLLKAGHRVVVWNRTHKKAEQLAAEGAHVARTPADACGGDVLITMLTGDDAVEDIVFGSGNVLAALGRDKIHCSMSTISVDLSVRLTQAHTQAGQGYVAAPVFGRPEAAAAAKLFIITAGRQATVARCHPLFDAMGQKTWMVGETPSMANLVKLSGNFLIASMLESLGEAFALVRKSGIDPHRYLEILTGTLFSAPIYQTYGTIIAEGAYEPAGFTMSLGLKDVRLALAAADARAVPMPVASLVHDHFLAGIAQGEGDADWSGLARLAARNAGL